MKQFIRLLLFALIFSCSAQYAAFAQAKAVPVNNPVFSIDPAGTNLTKVSTTSSIWMKGYDTISSANSYAPDTFKIKTVGGTHANMVHLWLDITKITGTTDSVTVTFYGSADTGKGANFVSLFTHQTVSQAATQVFNHIITNDYTNYRVIVKRIGVATISMRYRLWMLPR